MLKVLPYVLIYLTGVLLSAFSQVLLKKEAMKEHAGFLQEYLNPSVIISYSIFFGCTFLSMLAYRGIPMNWGPVLESSGYLFVTVLGALFLNERVNKKKALALLVIVAGILIYAL